MRILLTRTRIGADGPTYSYRVYVPFPEISLERQALIAMRSDFGLGAGLLARLPDVIAPMAHLEAGPCLDKYNFAKAVDGIADRVAAILLGSAFPEMTEQVLPFRLDVPSTPPNARIFGRSNDFSGRYETLVEACDRLTAASLGFRLENDR